VGVAAAGGARLEARAIADRLALPLLPRLPSGDEGDVGIVCDDDGVAFQLLGPTRPGPVPVTFDAPALRHRRRGGQNELLGRAVGWRARRSPRVLDATAGYGHDAFTLADLGCEVVMCERNPVLATLLERALLRARDSADDWLRDVAIRLRLLAGDARDLPRTQLDLIDVICLDPMFPQQRRALPSKEMQVLAALLAAEPAPGEESPGEADDAQLLAWACDQAVDRVVVKRPRRAPPLAGRSPSHTVTGRAVRFDVYVLHAAATAGKKV
jgi:16S rRNA (guanine1516-N2)-methyltransferase